MISHIKQEWIDALRSGDYPQCRNSMQKRDVVTKDVSYCCLGVLAVLTPGVTEWSTLGMSHDEVQQCIEWNDAEQKSFTEIADLIESHIPARLESPGVPAVNVDECGF